MAIIGLFDEVRKQLIGKQGFEVAMAYVEKCFTIGSVEFSRISAMSPGANEKVHLADGVFSLEQCYATKQSNEVKWESHKAYADVQVIFDGNEVMELTDSSQLQVDEDLTPDHDVVLYAMFGGGSVLRASAGYTAVFFPRDAHRPSLVDGASSIVRKMVVKVPL